MKLPEDIKNTIENFVMSKHNLDKDWFEMDLPRIEKCRDFDDFLIAMRPEGVDTLFITGPCKKFSNWEWFDCAINQGRSSEHYFHYEGKKKKFTKVSRTKALQVSKDTRNTFDEGYVADCMRRFEERWQHRVAEPAELSEMEWKKQEADNGKL